MHVHWAGVYQTTEKINFGAKLIISREGDDNGMSKEHTKMLIWESIIVWSSPNTMVTTVEWVMFELAEIPNFQERLYQQIYSVCGQMMLTEDHLEQLPYLNVVFLETLRRHIPPPLTLPRYALEDIEIGGYHIPAGTHVSQSFGFNYFSVVCVY